MASTTPPATAAPAMTPVLTLEGRGESDRLDVLPISAVDVCTASTVAVLMLALAVNIVTPVLPLVDVTCDAETDVVCRVEIDETRDSDVDGGGTAVIVAVVWTVANGAGVVDISGLVVTLVLVC